MERGHRECPQRPFGWVGKAAWAGVLPRSPRPRAATSGTAATASGEAQRPVAAVDEGVLDVLVADGVRVGVLPHR